MNTDFTEGNEGNKRVKMGFTVDKSRVNVPVMKPVDASVCCLDMIPIWVHIQICSITC
jgi:hypothetical protein